MKARRTRLAALFASALMLTSTFSPLVYAEDATAVVDEVVEETAEEAEDDVEEVAVDAVAEEAEEQVLGDDTEEAEPEVAEVETYEEEISYGDPTKVTGAYKVSDIKFLWSEDSTSQYYHSMDVQYKMTWTENGEEKWMYCKATASFDDSKYVAPTCTTAGRKILMVTITGSDPETTFSSDTLVSVPALGHDPQTLKTSTIKEAGHVTHDDNGNVTSDGAGKVHVWTKCSRCGYLEDTDQILSPQQHSFTETVYVAVDNVVYTEKTIGGKTVKVATLDKNGNVQLIDDDEDGYYYIRTYCKDDDGNYCGDYKEMKVYTGVSEKLETRLSDRIYYAVIISQTGINDDTIDNYIKNQTKFYYSTPSGVSDAHEASELFLMQTESGQEAIELANCEVPGSYIVRYYNGQGIMTSQRTFTVKKHHMETRAYVEFTDVDDKNMCTVTYKADGTAVVYNKSCYLTVTYKEVVHCTAEGCPLDECVNDTETEVEANVAYTDAIQHPYNLVHTTRTRYTTYNTTTTYTLNKQNAYTVVSSETKTKAPDGDHTYDDATLRAVAAEVYSEEGTTYVTLQEMVDYLSKDKVAALVNRTQGCTVDELQALLKSLSSSTDKNPYVNVTNDTSTCTADGTCDVEAICMVCKGAKKTTNVPVKAKGHIEVAPERQDVEKATCDSVGHYDAVTKCGVCKAQTRVVRDQIIPMTKHTNNLDRENSGKCYEDDKDLLKTSNLIIKFVGDQVVDPNDGSYLSQKGKVVTNPDNSDGTNNGSNYAGNGIKKTGTSGQPAGYNTFGVYPVIYSYCSECNTITTCPDETITGIDVNTGKVITGYHKVKLHDDIQTSLTLTIKDIQKQDLTGNNGTITLVATYTNSAGTKYTAEATFPYYSTQDVYNGRQDNSSSNGGSTTPTTTSGLVMDSDGVLRYYKDGAVDTTYTGLAEYHAEQYYVVNGVVDTTKNGPTVIGSRWYYLTNGMVDTTKDGILLFEDTDESGWFYFTNGCLNESLNGIVTYIDPTTGESGDFLFLQGRLEEYTGMYRDPYTGIWYALNRGQVQTWFSGPCYYNGSHFYIENGIYQKGFSGTIVDDNGITWKVVEGTCYAQL